MNAVDSFQQRRNEVQADCALSMFHPLMTSRRIRFVETFREHIATRLVEETEAHVLVGFFLLLFLLSRLLFLGSSGTASGSTTSSWSSGTATTTAGDRGEFGRAFGNEL